MAKRTRKKSEEVEKTETLEEFLTRMTQTETEEEAREATERIFEGAVENVRMIQSMGMVTIVVTEAGALKFTMSPHLQYSLVGLDIVEQALRDLQEKVIGPQRRKLIADMNKPAEAEDMESENSIEDTEEEELQEE